MHRCMCTSRSRHRVGEGSEIATAVSRRCAYVSARDGDGQARVAKSAIAALIIPNPPAAVVREEWTKFTEPADCSAGRRTAPVAN